MKKIILTIAVMACMVTCGFAQKDLQDSIKFSLGFETGLPLSNTKNIYSIALGGSVKVDLPISRLIGFTANAGYTSIKYQSSYTESTDASSSIGFVPVKVGFKYHFFKPLYAQAQMGVAFSVKSQGGTSFMYMPGLGAELGHIDLGVDYEAWKYTGIELKFINARLAYRF